MSAQDLIRELKRAQVEFQMRALLAALGVQDRTNQNPIKSQDRETGE